MKWLLVGAVVFLAWEGACELARLQRWHSEDPTSWRRKVAYRAEMEEGQ